MTARCWSYFPSFAERYLSTILSGLGTGGERRLVRPPKVDAPAGSCLSVRNKAVQFIRLNEKALHGKSPAGCIRPGVGMHRERPYHFDLGAGSFPMTFRQGRETMRSITVSSLPGAAAAVAPEIDLAAWRAHAALNRVEDDAIRERSGRPWRLPQAWRCLRPGPWKAATAVPWSHLPTWRRKPGNGRRAERRFRRACTTKVALILFVSRPDRVQLYARGRRHRERETACGIFFALRRALQP